MYVTLSGRPGVTSRMTSEMKKKRIKKKVLILAAITDTSALQKPWRFSSAASISKQIFHQFHA